MTDTILLVEDDAKLAGLMLELLQSHGWDISHCSSGEAAMAFLDTQPADLVLLDIMLPGIDGIEVCRRIRAAHDTRILMLTALGSDADQILGLEVGADDYLIKTAPPRLLLARIRALLRRGGAAAAAADRLDLGWCQLEPEQQRVWKAGREILLSSAEYEVLEVLARHAGAVVDRAELFQQLFHRAYDSSDRSLDRRIVRLRRSLDDGDGHYIRTVRGTGYLAITDRQDPGSRP